MSDAFRATRGRAFLRSLILAETLARTATVKLLQWYFRLTYCVKNGTTFDSMRFGLF